MCGVTVGRDFTQIADFDVVQPPLSPESTYELWSEERLICAVLAETSMEALDYWKLCDRVTVFQAAMLIIGIDPGTFNLTESETESVSRRREKARLR